MGALMSELPQERLTIALHSIAAAQKAFDLTRDYVRQRNAFGSPIGSFQNTRFKLADLKSDLAVGWAYADQCLREHIDREGLIEVLARWCYALLQEAISVSIVEVAVAVVAFDRRDCG